MAREQIVNGRYAIYLDDCMRVMGSLPDNSVHLSLYSPPFCGLYQYSSDPEDLSNTQNYDEFFEQYTFNIREIHRLTLPGRFTAVHCQDIIAGGMSDEPTITDFSGDIIRAHVRCRKDNCTAAPIERERGMCGHGWFRQTARYHVWKEPLLVRNRTMVKSLHHKTMTEDSTRCSMANADYLLVFRRSGKNTVLVAHPVGLLNYAGDRPIPDNLLKWRGYKGNQIKNEYSHWIWRRYADAFWDDVRIDRVLPYRESKDEQDEKHVHPLQLDTIERAIILWSNPEEVVLTPFMGIGSEVWGAVMNGRKGVGVELKKSYYNQAVKNLESIKEEAPEKVIVKEQRDLFSGQPDEGGTM